MPSHTATLPSIGLRLGAIWEMSVKMSRSSVTRASSRFNWRISVKLGQTMIRCSVGAIAMTIALSTGGLALAQPTEEAPASGMAMPPSSAPATLAEWGEGARLFHYLGSFHRKASTRSPLAQAYFDQGMRLLWAFNHDESTRSFAKAAEIDPTCAACFWGVALALGPNYNMPMMAEARARVGWAAVERARVLEGHASPVERALIEAIAKRFAGPKPLDPMSGAPILAAYAEAMKDVARRFPNDLDVQTMSAEAQMTMKPWQLWTPDGKPIPGTLDIIASLKAVLAKDPRHPGANHYLIHAVEASPHPEVGVVSAQRLVGMMPGAGHLQHMPAHIMQRVGRYEASAEANREGAAADVAYYRSTKAPDYYPMYTAHNYQFLAYSAAMEGRRAETMRAVRDSRAALSDDILAAMPGVDWYTAYSDLAAIRFGLWEQILAEPAPNAKLPGLTVGYLAAKTSALAAKGRVADADQAADALDAAIRATPVDYTAGMHAAAPAYAVYALQARARIAAAKGDKDGAVRLLTEAVGTEDKLEYDEPSEAFFPTRHLLGAALLTSHRAGEAEAVYREDLKRNPENGWALYGLAQALDAQHRGREAKAVRVRFAKAWRLADVKLTASAF